MAESLATLLDLITRPEFLTGVVAGFIALSLLLLARIANRSSALDWGLLLVASTLVTIYLTAGRRLGLAAGLGLLAIGGYGLRRSGPGARYLGWAMVILGSLVVTWRGGLSDSKWILIITALTIVLSGLALARWSVHLPNHLLGPLVAMSAFGIWATVPETEMARALLGTAIPMSLATPNPIESRLTPVGAFALAGIVVWVASSGGQARPASIIGAWTCLGMLVILPCLRRDPSDLVRKRPWVIVSVHAAVVLVASRVIGLWESALPAIIAAAFLVGITYLFLIYVQRRQI